MNLNLAANPAHNWRRDALSIGVGVVVVALLFAFLIGWLDPAWPWPPSRWTAATIALIALNVLPALLLFVLALALTRRVLLAGWLSLLVLLALYAGDAAKMRYLGTPLLPADLRLLGEAGPAIGLLGEYVHVGALNIVGIVLGIAFTALLIWRERGLAVLRGWRRAVLAAFVAIVGASLIAGSAPWPAIYDSDRLDFHPWALSESASNAGLISTLLLYQWQFAGGDIPKADRKAAAALLLAHAAALRTRLADMSAARDLPDIVVLQSESLFDPARLRDIGPGRWLRQYHRLAASATSGNMQVPTFGGGTIRTEFEVLAGAPLQSLGGMQYPWLELSRNVLPGLARVLAAHGYRNTAIHPNSAAFWNRARAFPALGFDRFIDGSAFSKDRIVGLFTSDAALTDRILAELNRAEPDHAETDNAGSNHAGSNSAGSNSAGPNPAGGNADGAPQFLFAISMENHGPFDWRPGLDPDRLAALPMPDKLDAGGRVWFGNYLYLLEDADHELGRLADALRKRKRRTLLLFYGDHLPSLAPVYFQLGFDDGKDAMTQPVPWLLFDSADSKARHLDTHSWLLPDVLLDAAGIGDATYFTLIDTLRGEIHLDDGPPDAADQAGIDALARLQLRGELDAFVRKTLGPIAPVAASAPAPAR